MSERCLCLPKVFSCKHIFLILMFVSNDKLCIVEEICSNLIQFKIIGERLAQSRWMEKTVSYPLNLKAQLCSFKSRWYSERAC